MIKVFEISGIQGTYLDIIKRNIQQADSQYQVKCREALSKSIKISIKTGDGGLHL